MSKKSNRPKKSGIVTAKEKVDTTPAVEQDATQQADWQQRAAESQPPVDDELDFETEPVEGDSSTETPDGETESEAPATPTHNSDEGVKVFMLTDYRTFAKKGQVYTVDAGKADELIRLKRAVAYDPKQHKKAPKAN